MIGKRLSRVGWLKLQAVQVKNQEWKMETENGEGIRG